MAFPTTDFMVHAIELWLRAANYGNLWFTLWMVPAKLYCLSFVNNPCGLLGDVEKGPEHYNRSVNLVIDENLEVAWNLSVTIRACRDEVQETIGFQTVASPEKVLKRALFIVKPLQNV